MSASIQNRRGNLVPALAHLTDIVATRGEGPFLFDSQGRRYLDFTSGIGVTNTGHCHPRVVAAIREQAGRLLHAQASIVYQEPMLRLIDELVAVLPRGLDSLFFANSGAEAVEAGIKLARQSTGRTNIVVFQGSFHGRTVGAMSLTTSKTAYRSGYQPLMPGVFVAPYPYAFRYRWSAEETLAWCIEELRHVLATQTAPDETAAVLVEPVLGEGGYVPPPEGFLRALRDVCDEHGLLLIADEVQTGFGRTGALFAVEHADVRPDILIMAKGMASGLPLGAIATRSDLSARWPRGSHGSTFGGNIVACAAAAATMEVIREERLAENARETGRMLLDGLREIQRHHEAVADVRGIGLMIGTEFRSTKGRSPGQLAKEVQRACLDRDLLLLTCGLHDHVIRWIPPLIIGQDHVRTALDTFQGALKQAGC